MKKIALRLRNLKTVDWVLVLIPILISFGGLATIYSITFGSDQVSLAWRQLIWLSLGIVIMILLSRYDYRGLRSLSPIIYIFCLILLVSVVFLGTIQLGARRWIDLGIFQLQPSELAKLGAVILLGGLLSSWQKVGLRQIMTWLLVIGIPFLLVIGQPDFGTAIIILGIGLLMLVFSAIRRRFLAIVLAAFAVLAPIVWFTLRDYQRQRLLVFIDPSRDPFGAGYNVLQSLIAVGSGGLFGRGLGQGPQSQLNFLPIAHSDFIFAGWAEATGLIGSIILIGLFVALILRTLVIAKHAPDRFGMFLGLGIAAVFFLQILINIGMNLGLLPVTGVPLPFFSYGGTMIIVNFAAIGILQSIHLRHHKIVF